jgi:hypothetical protein
MKKRFIIRAFLVLAALGIITAGLVYRFVYNKPHTDFEKAKPEYMVSAAELFDSFRNDRQLAEARYNGKVVLLSGRLDKIEASDSQVTAVFVFDQGVFGDEGIRCTMLPSHTGNLKTYLDTQEVRLKGFLTGYNDTDVILEQCSIVR